MPEFKAPRVYLEEVSFRAKTIEGVSTDTVAMVGFVESGPLSPTVVTSFTEYRTRFGGFGVSGCLPYAVQGFFDNGGLRCCVLPVRPSIADCAATLSALDDLQDITLICCPDEHALPGMSRALVQNCERSRACLAILAAPKGSDLAGCPPAELQSSFAAYYAPWVLVANPTGGAPIAVHPGGHIAGAMVANDRSRGPSKVPANLPVKGIVGLERTITEKQQEVLNPRGVNILRAFPGRGTLIWGGRTTSMDPEWKYVSVRRYLMYLELSLSRGTQWAVFEPNGSRLWANAKQAIENFLFNEWQSGALLGSTPQQAYFVRCDRSTMTQDDLDNGRLVCLVGVAALKPAEFVNFRIGQWTADAKRP